MTISTALIYITHLLSFLGFTTLVLTGQINYLIIILFYLSLIASFVSEVYKKNFYFTQGASTLLALVLLAYVFLSILFLGEEIFQGILKFLIFTQMVKHLGKKNMRDIMQIYIISFFQFVAGAIITIEIAYGFAFILYIAMALFGLLIYNLKKESLNTSVDSEYKLVTKPFIISSVFLSACVVFFSIVLFVSLPRLRAGLFSSEFLEPKVLKTGFSDSVRLGKVGEIKRDNSAVMRVKILNNDNKRINRDLYWRGIALDYFDGFAWSIDSANYGDYERIYRRNSKGVINISTNQKDIIAQDIITEPIDTDILFAIHKPVGFSETSRRIYEVNESYFLPYKPKQRIKYKAYSALYEPSGEELRNTLSDYSYYIRTRYLQLTDISDQMKTLALDITRNESNTFDKVNSIKRYLLSEMNYTLTLESDSEEFPLDEFIFDKKSGHCEYFATAMVVFLRINGIPSRIVNGFISGQWNEHGNFYLIRESDAHSWVEVYYPEYGWITVDPTPASLDNRDNIFILSSIISYIDYIKFRWQRYVIDYSQSDQVRLFKDTRRTLSWNQAMLSNRIKRTLNLDRGIIMTLSILILIVFIIVFGNRFAEILKYRKKPHNVVIGIYNDSLNYLSKRGIKKEDSETPLEFADSLVLRNRGKFELFKRFTEQYLEARFNSDSSSVSVSELKNSLKELKNSI